MKGKTKLFVGLMALSLLGAIGSTVALTRNGTTASGNSPVVDSAIYLYWDSQSDSSSTLSGISQVQVNTPVYRYLTVAPRSTKSVEGTLTLTFTLAADTGCIIDGLTVSVYQTASLATDLTVSDLIDEVTPTPVLNSGNLSGSTSFAISKGADVHETKRYFAIEVNYIPVQGVSGTLGGLVTISQDFAA